MSPANLELSLEGNIVGASAVYLLVVASSRKTVHAVHFNTASPIAIGS